MKNLKHHKKSGFTLTEIAIAVMIVGLLLALTLPVLRGVLQKSDDYAYYLAYRTVEKLGGQIVALGDPNDTLYNAYSDDGVKTASSSILSEKFDGAVNSARSFFSSVGSRFVFTGNYVFKKLFPKTFADDWVLAGEWDNSEFDSITLIKKVCKGEKVEKSKNEETGEVTYYSASDFPGADCSGDMYNDENTASNFIPFEPFVCGYNSASEMASDLSSHMEGDAKELCKHIKTKCTKSEGQVSETPNTAYKVEMNEVHEDAECDEDGCDAAEDVVYCRFYTKESSSSSSGGANSVTINPPEVTNICTPAYGYYGMYNSAAPYALNCECNNGYIESYNNDKVCCAPQANFTAYARSGLSSSATSSNLCVYCAMDRDFNTITNKCCPSHSVFNGTKCEPVDGYGNCDDNICHRTKCSKGLHFDAESETCVLNPPIVKAKRLCELIADNWNISSSNCSTFSSGDPSVYQAVYKAATGTNGRYLSISSKTDENSNFSAKNGAIPPNIIMANGLKLWILGDKAASVPGLSYTPVGVEATRNMCIELKNGNNPIASPTTCTSLGGYSCKGEGHCYTLSSQSLTTMGDARNCCSSADISDISYQSGYEKDNRVFAINGFTVFVDINGDKGSGSLWEDVFPFFVSANGTVYPGYPLDAPKGRGDNVPNGLYLGGNNVANLAVDVFYYENVNGGTTRKRVSVFPNVSYARGACFSRKISEYTPYCQNLGLKAKDAGNSEAAIKEAITSGSNKCNSHNCHLSVRNKVKFF